MTDAATTRKILVADDEPAIRDLLVFNLRAEGFHVEAVDNGDDACAVAPALLPDLIVLDWMMPGRDGLSTLGVLKADPTTQDIPVVLLTAKATDAEVWEGWEAGADYYITKPFDVDELLHFVKYLWD